MGYKVMCKTAAASRWYVFNLGPNVNTFDPESFETMPGSPSDTIADEAYVMHLNDKSSEYHFKMAAITRYTHDRSPYSAGAFSVEYTAGYVAFYQTVKMRGTSVDSGFIDFYFTARTTSGEYRQYDDSFWRLTNGGARFPEGTDISDIEIALRDPNLSVLKNGRPDGTGWPSDIIAPDGYGRPDVTAEVIEDFYGRALAITFALIPYGGYPCWDVQSTKIGLDGIGSFMIQSDYTTGISFLNGDDQNVDDYEIIDPSKPAFLIWTVNASFNYDANRSLNENVPQGSKEFKIPIYVGDTLKSIRSVIENGTVDKVPSYKGLQEQLHDFFMNPETSTLPPEIREIYADSAQNGQPFVVTTELVVEKEMYMGKAVDVEKLNVNISTLAERVQNQISCRVENVRCFYLETKPNVYYVSHPVFELRSFEDMYGRNKPGSTNISKGDGSVKRSYGFKFNLDYITDYDEEEQSQIDMTPIPGTSSGNAIGLDMVGATRTITIKGIRVDNSNDWMFHAPFEFVDDPGTLSKKKSTVQGGIIYIGTSNWGWIKFMKAIMGTFQFIDGPYRLIVMTMPSSLMQQYFPDKGCKYQYSDGTYVVQVGTEDMCYVMIESFTHGKTDEMFNAISYSLKLRRVAQLGTTI